MSVHIQGDTEPAGNDVSPECEALTPVSKPHLQVYTVYYYQV